MNKHSMVLFLVATLLAMLLTRERRWLATPWPWLGGVIAATILLPNMAWQVRHHWPTLEFLGNTVAKKSGSGSHLGLFKAQLMLLHPMSAPLWIGGLGALLFWTELRRARVIGLTFVLVWVMVDVLHGNDYHLAPAFPPLLAAGAVSLVRFADTYRCQWIKSTHVAALALSSILTVPLFIIPVLPPEDRARCANLAGNYGEAAAIDLLGPKYGLPRAVSGHNNYYLWGPPSADRSVVITVGESAKEIGTLCRDVEEATVFRHGYNMAFEVMRQSAGTMAAHPVGFSAISRF